MKKLLMVLAILGAAALPGIVQAETMYICDRLEVAVRTGKGLQYKILAIARTNDPVEVIGTEGEYCLVRLPNDVEGWVLKRYLTEELPKPQVIARLESQMEQMKSRLNATREEAAQSKQREREFRQSRDTEHARAARLEQELTGLQESCADFISLRNDYEQLQREMDGVRQENGRLGKENAQLRKKAYFWGAVAGCGFALFWFAVGMAFQGSRAKRRQRLHF